MTQLFIDISCNDIADTITHYVMQQGYSLTGTNQNAALLLTDNLTHAHNNATCPSILLYEPCISAPEEANIAGITALTLPISLPALLHNIHRAINAHLTPLIPLHNGWVFVPTMHHITHPTDTSVIILTEKESQLLKQLCSNPTTSIDRQSLLINIWGYGSDTSTHTLETHMYRLRQKLAKCGTDTLIKTTENGYQMML